MPLRRDQVQEGARELREDGRDEREVLVDAAHQRGGPCHRDERVHHRGEDGPSPVGVLELALDRRPVDALDAGEGDREREQDPGEHADVHQREPLDLQRWSVLDAGRGDEVGRSSLRVLPRCFFPSTVPAGSAAGCTNGITSPTRSLPSAFTAAAMARSLPTSCAVSTSTAATSRLSQYSSPDASAEVKSSRAMFVCRSTRMCDASRLPWLMPAAWSCSISLQTAASVSSVIASGSIAPSGPPAAGS